MQGQWVSSYNTSILLLFVVVLLVTAVCTADRMVVLDDCCVCTVVEMFHFYAHNSSIDCQQVYLDFWLESAMCRVSVDHFVIYMNDCLTVHKNVLKIITAILAWVVS